MQTIGLIPTWGEIGTLYFRLAERVRAVIRAEMTKQGYAADEAQSNAGGTDA